MSNTQTIKVACGDFIKPLKLTYVDKRIECQFGYNKKLIAVIKALEGARWHGYDDDNPRKIWTILNSQHNTFRLRYMSWLAQPLAYRKAHPQEDPYYVYDKPLVEFHSHRPLYDHQQEMAKMILTRHYCEFACEMGTGKTLAAIEGAEKAGMKTGDVWYVGPKAGVRAVKRELRKWSCNHEWRYFTYEELVSYLKKLPGEIAAPKYFVIDEASKVKNASAQRSQAVAFVADAVRSEHGNTGYVVEMSGTPAPKDPSDWWHQIRIIAPGFIAEGSKEQFKRNLCLMEQKESLAGGSYPHLVTWWDDPKKCKVCGDTKEQHPGTGGDHTFAKSEDKVSNIYKRLNGLVLVRFKEDCLDLPEKRYEVIDIMPTPEMLRTAKMIAKHSGRAAHTLNLLRQLSDGFQYSDKKIGDEQCPECHGKKTTTQHVPIQQPGPSADVTPEQFTKEDAICPLCGGTGSVPKYERTTEIVGSPKDEFFINDLDLHEDHGRYTVWGGFQGTIDRLTDMAHKYGWATLQLDGRGYFGMSALGEVIDIEILLDCMDASTPHYKELCIRHPKVCTVGNPEAGGMAWTFTASPTGLYYSNSFKGDARPQSEDRGHRAGMPNRAYTIKDLICLPSDQLVLDNLKKKIDLQAKTMGRIKVSHEEILACFK